MSTPTRERMVDRVRVPIAVALSVTALVFTIGTRPAGAGESGPGFDKRFVPDVIGPGSTTTLTFTIDNSTSFVPAEDLAFTDTLPSGVTIAAPANASTTCAADGPGGPTLVAPPGGSTITFAVAAVPAGAICTVGVDVTAATDDDETTDHDNTSSTLTSTLGTSSAASDTLTVDIGLPGFTKEFSPATVEFGERSTLTFTIDNSLNTADVDDLVFTDDLPTGMVVADPPNASTDCASPANATPLTATPGSSTISLSAFGLFGIPALADDSICTVVVDVIGAAVGALGNTSGELLATISASTESAGSASAVLTVNEFEVLLQLVKEFTTDPVAPGGTALLEFTITNKSRDDAATDLEFTDDLDATLSGLEAIAAAGNTCGGMAGSTFPTGLFEYEGGSLPPEGTCTVTIEVLVPDTSADGTYTNTAGPVTGTVAGDAEVGNSAGDLLFVVSSPQLVKQFTDDPVGAGGVVTIEFTLSNPSTETAMSDIAFTDQLDTVVTTSPSGPPADGFCGGSSTASFTPLTPAAFEPNATLTVSGASLAAKGSPGDSCTFSLALDVDPAAGSGTYPNLTSAVTGVLDDIGGTPAVSGPPAAADLVVVGAPQLSKEFTDDPALPGRTVALEFTLEHFDPNHAATDISFTDDLDGTLSGLTLTSVDTDTCGGTPSGVGTGLFDYAGGTLGAGAACTIVLTLTVPSGVSGAFPNETSELTATVGGLAAASSAAHDDLLVEGLRLAKDVTDDPVIAGGTATVVFTLDNDGAVDATGVTFSDDLDAALDGLTATAVGPNTCAGSTVDISSPSAVVFSDGSVDAGASCSFEVTVTVPAPTPDDTYRNVTSAVSSSLGTSSPAVDDLVVQSTLIELAKEFTDDPVTPGDTVTLQFTLTNLSPTETLTDVAFDDDLDAALAGLEATSAVANTCTDGTAVSSMPTGLFEYEGATLLPAESCTVMVLVQVPDPLPSSPPFVNVTTGATGKVGALDVFGEPAGDELLVRTATLSKSFDGPIRSGKTGVLTFTIENLDPLTPLGPVALSDDLDATLPDLVAVAPLPSTPCGPGSVLAGTSFLTLIGATLPAGGSCSFDVTVMVPSGVMAGEHLNVTSALLASGLPVAGPATDSLFTLNPPFTLVDGRRYADTRIGGSTFDGLFEGDGRRPAGSTYEVTIAGRGDVPADAVGVIVNVTSVGSSPPPGFFTVFACGSVPTASALNYVSGVDVANEVFAKLSPAGSVCVFTFSGSNLLLDVVGYVGAHDSVKLLDVARLAESREGAPTVDGLMAGFGRTAPGSITIVPIAGRGGVPADVSAAILNIAAVDPDDTSFLTVYDCSPPVPTASSINYTAGVNRANEIIAEVNDDGAICIFTDTDIELIVDVYGYVEAGSDLVGTGPARFTDSRGGPTVDGVDSGGGPLAPGSTTEIVVAGRGGVPADATAIVANVAAVDPLTAGFLTVTGCVTPIPDISAVNFTAGVNGANEVVVDLSDAGTICVFTSASTDLLVDVVGYVKPNALS